MKNALYIILLSSLIFTQDNIGGTLYLDDLINYLQDNYTTNNVLNYDSARDVLYGNIDNDNGSVSCIYTNFSVHNVPVNSPRPTVHSGGLDCEHLWPQSIYEG